MTSPNWCPLWTPWWLLDLPWQRAPAASVRDSAFVALPRADMLDRDYTRMCAAREERTQCAQGKRARAWSKSRTRVHALPQVLVRYEKTHRSYMALTCSLLPSSASARADEGKHYLRIILSVEREQIPRIVSWRMASDTESLIWFVREFCVNECAKSRKVLQKTQRASSQADLGTVEAATDTYRWLLPSAARSECEKPRPPNISA